MNLHKAIERAEKEADANLNIVFMFDLCDFKGVIKEYEINYLFDTRFKLLELAKGIKLNKYLLHKEIGNDNINLNAIDHIEHKIRLMLKDVIATTRINECERMAIADKCIARLKEFQKMENIPDSIRRINIEDLRNINGF